MTDAEIRLMGRIVGQRDALLDCLGSIGDDFNGAILNCERDPTGKYVLIPIKDLTELTTTIDALMRAAAKFEARGNPGIPPHP